MYGEHGIYAYTPEVGAASDGFWPATSRIVPLAEENLFPNKFAAWAVGAKYDVSFGIEDGLGDYLSKYWRYSTLSFYDIQAHQLETIKSLAKYFILCIVLGSLKKSKEIALPSRTQRREKFSVLPRPGETVVGNHLLRNIKKLAESKSHRIDRQVLIIGTIFDSRFQFGFEEEICLYQKLFDEIRRRHKVESSQIWYKHHPRLSKDLWEKKKNRLDCQYFEY